MNKGKKLRKGITRRRWTRAELNTLRRLHGTHSDCEIARQLGRRTGAIRAMAHRLGLEKSEERLIEMGRENVGLRWAAYRRLA